MRSLLRWVILCVVFASACGGDSNATSDADIDAPSGTWETAIAGTWTLTSGTRDTYLCIRQTVSETVYVTGLRALSPIGTHHTVLTVSNGSAPDGQFPCNAFNNEDAMLFASGVGSDEYHFPEGVAVKVEAGQQLFLNIHLFNASDIDYVDRVTGIEFLTTEADNVDAFAEMIFAGTVLFDIPNNGVDYTSSGDCVLKSDSTLINIWPHMHQVGKHMKVEHEGTVIHDEPFSFNEQKNYPKEPIALRSGDRLRVTCTWNNTTTAEIGFGDKSTDEMCFAGFYRYPATGDEGAFCDLPLL